MRLEDCRERRSAALPGRGLPALKGDKRERRVVGIWPSRAFTPPHLRFRPSKLRKKLEKIVCAPSASKTTLGTIKRIATSGS